jgi:predicted DNA-binding protein
MHILNVKISDELHKRFKLACVHEDKEMSAVVRKWIEEYVEKIEKKLKKK